MIENLKTETLEALKENGKTIDDIRWIGVGGVEILNFWDIADMKYDAGYGGAEIPQNLYIVGDDWWLERAEYDGSEWWEFKKKPDKPTTARYMRFEKNNYRFIGLTDLILVFDDIDESYEEDGGWKWVGR